jgi:hypothetical protein
MYVTSGFFLGKSVVKFIFFHLYFFLILFLGNPNSEPIFVPSTKYTVPSIFIFEVLEGCVYISSGCVFDGNFLNP